MDPFKIPKKVNRHVIKAIDFLQTSRTDFVHIEAIENQVRRSLRYTKPVNNLDFVIKESLRKQTELGIVSRSGSSMFGMTLAFKGLRSDRNAHKIKKNGNHTRSANSLTVDEIASVRKILRGAQKPLVKNKSTVLSRALFKRRSNKPPNIIYDKFDLSIEKLKVPKKVNRHVFKAIRYFTNNENCGFVPLDKIKMEVKWTMKNLNPLHNLETIIERSLTNLGNMGVLSELRGAYRLNPVQSLSADSSVVIFGKVSKSFFHVAPIDESITTDLHSSKDTHASCNYLQGNASSIEPNGGPFQMPMVISETFSHESHGADELQNISYMERREKHLDEPMSDDSKFSASQGTMPSSTYIQAEQTSPLYPVIINFRASEGVNGEEPNFENVFSVEPLHVPPLVTLESPSQEIQCADEPQNMSYMNERELPVDEPMSDHSSTFSGSQGTMQSSTFIQAEETSPLCPIIRNFRASEGVNGEEPNFENVFSVEPLHVPPLVTSESPSQEIQCADESQNMSYMNSSELPVDEPMSDHSSIFSGSQGTMQSTTFIQAEQTLRLSPIIRNFRASEGVNGEEPNFENVFSVEPLHVPPLVTSESPSQEIQCADESQNMSYMNSSELPVDEPMSDHSSIFSGSQGTMPSTTFIQAEQALPLCPMNQNCGASEVVIGEELPNIENASSPLVTSGSAFQEIQGADESQDISYMTSSELPLDEPMSDHSVASVPIIRNFRASEGTFGVEPENASPIAFCVQLPLMASVSIPQEMHNVRTTDYNFEIGFYESWLQSISNEPPTLILREANSESEESSNQPEPDEQ